MALTAADIHQRLVWKLDLLLLPLLSILFFLQSLAKSNLTSTETAHFTEDIGISKTALNGSIACFYITFIALQPVGAVLGRRYGMVRFVPACMILWGLCTALHAGVRKSWQLVVLRTLIGVFEAGFYPTTVTYLCLFYTRFEFATRLGLFHGLAAVTGAFGGLLSWALFKKIPNPKHPDSTLGIVAQRPSWNFPLKPWQFLFIVEGIAIIALAVLAYILLPHNPETAWFLTPEERACASSRMRLDARSCAEVGEETDRDNESIYSEAGSLEDDKKSDFECEDSSSVCTLRDLEEAHELLRGGGERSPITHIPMADCAITRADIESAFASWHVWYLLGCGFLSAIPANAFPVFLPAVIRGLTYSGSDMGQTGEMAPATANVLIVPPFFLGAFALWICAAWSDRYQQRLRPVLWGLGILIVGLAFTVLLPPKALVARYLALMVLLAGSLVPGPLIIAWLVGNTLEPNKRAVALGVNGWANLAAPLASIMFAPRTRESGYMLPFVIALLCAGIGIVAVAVFRAAIVAQNQGRLGITAAWGRETRVQEARHGDVPVYLRRTRLARLRGQGVARRGEERLTYRFTT